MTGTVPGKSHDGHHCTLPGLAILIHKRYLNPTASHATQKLFGRCGVAFIVLSALLVATFSKDALVLLGGLAVAFGFQMWPSLAAICWFPWITRQGATWGLAAGLLGIFLGWLGVHRFYLGQWWGIFYLLLFWTGLPGIIGLVEGIVFLVSDQDRWDDKFNDGIPAGKGEGANAAILIVVIVAVLFFGIALLGIIAAIAIPAYHDYTIRAKVHRSMNIVAGQLIAH